MDKFKILLMYSGLVDIPPRDGQEAVRGLSIEYYFFGNEGEMVQSRVSADGISGTRRGKVFADADVQKKVSYVPGIYEGTFEMSIGSDGKPVLKLVDIDYLSKAQIIEEKSKADKADKSEAK